MSSKVEIVNLALSRLGEAPIQDLSEGSVPASMADQFYDPARRAVLRGFHWNFALDTARLAKLEEEPVGFLFAFSLPSDCLKVIRALLDGWRDVPCYKGEKFVLRSGRLLADIDPLSVEYIRDVTDPEEFDDRFTEAFSYKLASDLAVPVKGSSELMASFMNAYSALIRDAASVSVAEQRFPRSETPYTDARW